MIKKIRVFVVLFLSLIFLVACKQTDVKTENSIKAIQVLKKYYKEQYNQSEEISNTTINYYVWENDSKYYVLALSSLGSSGVAVDVNKNEIIPPADEKYSVEQVVNKKYKEEKKSPDYQEINNSDVKATLKVYMRELE